nr:hypothetical protein [Leptospirillum ferriphilum]
MRYRYVPFLRWKRGERHGVKNLSPQTKQGITPLFILDSENYKERKETKNNPAITPSAHIAKELFSIMGKTSFYSASDIRTQLVTVLFRKYWPGSRFIKQMWPPWSARRPLLYRQKGFGRLAFSCFTTRCFPNLKE